jgi:hypothetical protein
MCVYVYVLESVWMYLYVLKDACKRSLGVWQDWSNQQYVLYVVSSWTPCLSTLSSHRI